MLAFAAEPAGLFLVACESQFPPIFKVVMLSQSHSIHLK